MWNPESGKICLWNPESWVLESGIQLKESGIPQIFWIRNPISIDKRLESSNWKLESTVWNPESRIKDCLGFPNMGQILSSISAVMASMLNKNLGLKTRLSDKEKKHYFPFAFGCAIGPSSCMLPSARPMSFSFAESTVLRLQVNCKKRKVEMRKFDCNSFRISCNTNFKKKLTSFLSKLSGEIQL